MIGKRLINTGVAAEGALVPSEHFETVTYTGNSGTQRIGGYINRGGVFNGSSSYITLPNSTEGIGEVDSSFSFWVYPVSVSSGYEIVALLTNNDWIEIRYNSSGQFVIYPARQSNDTYVSLTAVTKAANNWYNIVITRDSATSTIKLYIDGSLVETNTSWDGTLTSAASSPNGLGANVSSNTLHFSGKLDQIRFFNKALSSGEVTTLYGETHASTTKSTTDIFDDNSGVALYQLDGNANDTGGVSGKFGSAAIFNGTNASLDIESSDLIQNNIESFSFWFKNKFVLGFYDPSAASSTDRRRWFINNNTNGSIKIEVNNNQYDYEQTGITEDSNWHHLAVLSNGYIYLDGTALASQFSTSYWITDGTNGTSRDTIRIGSADFIGVADSSFYAGSIDDLRFYSDVLTSTEVGYIYNNTTASIPTDNLEAYYKFDGDARDEQQLYDGTASNVTYAYDGTASNVTYQEATKFQPDLVWIKNRTDVVGHRIYDVMRGLGGTEEYLASDTTDSSVIAGAGGVTDVFSNGFAVGSGNAHNGSGDNIVAWCWKAGGAAVSNTDGSITSQVSVNQAAGFSIVKWTSTGSNTSSETVGHGLGNPPDVIILKNLSAAGTSWRVYHSGIPSPNNALALNTTELAFPFFPSVSSNTFGLANSTTTGEASGTGGQNIIAYCFHSVDGYQKAGSYIGTGVAGNTVETGFEPAFLLIKQTNISGSEWNIIDNKRDTQNPRDVTLWANSNASEATASQSGVYDVNFLSNGFSLENTYQSFNASGGTYIYLAIAADPDTTTPTVENSFDVVTYQGNGSTQEIATDFKPDLMWIKKRSSAIAADHMWFDSVRGLDKVIGSERTDAEYDGGGTGYMSSVDSDGFTLTGNLIVNESSQSFVAWCWKAGDHDDNLPQINTEGSIDSVVSVNAEAGFSIVKYTGNGNTSQQSYGHGLSSAPELVINKSLDTVTQGTNFWVVGGTILGNGGYMFLNATNAKNTASAYNGNQVPDSSVVYISGTSDLVHNESGKNFISYCFHSVSGYQMIGSYTGSTSAVSVTTGFQPRFVLVKNSTTSGSNWTLWDDIRGGSVFLQPNNSGTEASGRTLTFNSDGFTINTDAGVNGNSNGDTYIYLAIA